MLDIKVKKPVSMKTNKIPQKVNEFQMEDTFEVEEAVVTLNNKVSKISIFSSILFVFMIGSISTYVFMVSSTVYFAVKESRFTYKSESFKNSNLTILNSETIAEFGKADKNNDSKISYINIDPERNISLK